MHVRGTLLIESSFLFGRRKGRYLPLAINNSDVSRIEAENPYRVVMLGDYSSGISRLRNELVKLNSFKHGPFSDAQCRTTVMQDGREMQIWLFIDLHNFELFCKQCTESIDCCLACYSITIAQTYRHAVDKWLPEFVNKFPGKPIILCALNGDEMCTCGGGIDETLFQNNFDFCHSHLTQVDVSIFDKHSVKSLYNCIKGTLHISELKQKKKENKMKACILM
uniref:Rab-like protein 3 n=1 Tax=Elaeophora elaphi TaxID=1147741 RepID=A0A0R3RYH0_9BILA